MSFENRDEHLMREMEAADDEVARIMANYHESRQFPDLNKFYENYREFKMPSITEEDEMVSLQAQLERDELLNIPIPEATEESSDSESSGDILDAPTKESAWRRWRRQEREWQLRQQINSIMGVALRRDSDPCTTESDCDTNMDWDDSEEGTEDWTPPSKREAVEDSESEF